MTKFETVFGYAAPEDFDGLYDFFQSEELFTADEISLVCSLNGRRVDVMLDMLYVRYGNRSLEQYAMDCE